MARRTGENGSFGPRIHRDPIFWKEVDASDNEALKIALNEIVDQSSALTKHVATALPNFTLHDRMHLDNVLYWMEQFVTPSGLQELGLAGCALCVVLAYVHDIGMVPEPGWEDRLGDPNSKEHTSFGRLAAERHLDFQKSKVTHVNIDVS